MRTAAATFYGVEMVILESSKSYIAVITMLTVAVLEFMSLFYIKLGEFTK